jgi:hypothetical protein
MQAFIIDFLSLGSRDAIGPVLFNYTAKGWPFIVFWWGT